MKQTFLGNRLDVVVGDITLETTDAIVNAAAPSLLGGGGVDGAIHAAGGDAILEACREIRKTRYPRGLPTGEAVITTAGKLETRFVIHTVGPVFGHENGREPELLAACYLNSLRLAAANNLKSVAFPAISTGVFGYPRDRAAAIVADTLRRFISENTSPYLIRLVFHSTNDAEIFLDEARFDANRLV